jgi:predicted O-linked N-acetylglucosamine transferase (SPINDLY family)
MVTLAGKTFVSRMASSILHHSGLDGLIATSHANYEELAVTLAGRKDILHNVKQQLLQQRQPGGAFDMNEFTKNLESKYLEVIVSSHRSGR